MKAYTKEELLEKYKAKHGNKYDYSELDLVNKVNGRIKITCPLHGQFLQNHYDHLNSGCPLCGSIRKKQKLSTKYYIHDFDDLKKQCLNKFGDQFDFSKTIYTHVGTRLTIKCKIHNKVFHNTAYHIIRGQGCPDCKKDKISIKKKLGNITFINRSNAVHINKYNYSLVEYKTLVDPVLIICPTHGQFRQKPREHLSGSGCQQCAGTSISKISQVWLGSLNLPLELEYKIHYPNGYYVVDGYDKSTNTIYEFYGDYWHGNPAIFEADTINASLDISFGELYTNTLNRETILKNLGFNLVTIWEAEFNELKNI